VLLESSNWKCTGFSLRSRSVKLRPNPTPSGMFTCVPARDELSSNVVGLDVYNKDKQNIGTIKDIALDASGLNGYIIDIGGFLGMDDRYVVVRLSAISIDAKDNKCDRHGEGAPSNSIGHHRKLWSCRRSGCLRGGKN
jgi:hypothetical protein